MKRPLAREMKNMPASDHDRVRQTLEGDPVAFDQLMEKYMSRTYRIAFRMVNNREASLKAYQALRGFRKELGFSHGFAGYSSTSVRTTFERRDFVCDSNPFSRKKMKRRLKKT